MASLTADTTGRAADIGRPTYPQHVYGLSLSLAVLGVLAAALTFAVPDILTGPPVTNGNARGTALVMLALAIPTLLASLVLTARGSWRSILVWLGSVFYLIYNSFLLLFLTPFNRLFVLYVATFSVALFAAFALIRAADIQQLSERLRRLPVKALAIYVWTVVFLNAAAWLRTALPATIAEDPTSFLEGMGVATNAIYIQDLAVWLPLMAVAGWWLWQRKPIGILLTGSWLVFGVMESVGIAVDQWFGHRADPTSTFASESAIYLAVIVAVIGLIPLYFFFKPEPVDLDLTARRHAIEQRREQ